MHQILLAVRREISGWSFKSHGVPAILVRTSLEAQRNDLDSRAVQLAEDVKLEAHLQPPVVGEDSDVPGDYALLTDRDTNAAFQVTLQDAELDSGQERHLDIDIDVDVKRCKVDGAPELETVVVVRAQISGEAYIFART